MTLLRMLEEHHHLETRSPRGGGGKAGWIKGGKGKSGSGSSSSSSSTVVVVGGGSTSYGQYHGGGGEAYIGSLPAWAVVLITWFSIILVLFLCALLYSCLKERKRSRREGHGPRHGTALWNAVKVALFIWLLVKIWECCCGKSRHKSGRSKGGRYAKVGEDGQHGAGEWYGAPMTPAVTEVPKSYGAGGTGHAPAEGKYEPLGYSAVPTVPSPLISPRLKDATASGSVGSPPLNDASTATTTPAPTGPYAFVTSTGGESQSYYASMRISPSYTPSISSVYEPSVPSPVPTPAAAYQAAYHPPVSPEPSDHLIYPQKATYVPQISPGPRSGGF